MKPEKIAFLGFMGAGKSTVAALLAEQLGYQVIELDDEIVAQSPYASIAEIFASEGEAGFREQEKQALLQVLKHTRTVLSPGGGLIESGKNMELLRDSGFLLVYLRAPFELLRERAFADTSRPLFSNLDQAQRRYEKRLPLYEKWADHEIYVLEKSPDELVAEILSLW